MTALNLSLIVFGPLAIVGALAWLVRRAQHGDNASDVAAGRAAVRMAERDHDRAASELRGQRPQGGAR